MSETTQAGVPERGRQHPAQRAWSLLVDGLAVVATVFIAVLMVVICADIVARNGMGSSLPLVSELGAMIVVLIVALQLPSAVAADRLARVELLMDALSADFPRVVSFLSALFALVAFVLLGMVAWASFDIFQDALDTRDFIGTPGMGTLPTWPFRALISLGMGVAALEFLFKALGHLRQIFHTERQGS